MSAVPKLPAHLLHQADQARALMDASVTKMLAEMRDDLTRVDPTALWWAMSHVWTKSKQHPRAGHRVGLGDDASRPTAAG